MDEVLYYNPIIKIISDIVLHHVLHNVLHN